jgi:hypothetical protein
MSLPPRFVSLTGEWRGTKRLYLNGESGPEHRSVARMTIARAVHETFLLLAYSWKFERDPHEGVLLLAYDETQNEATAAWGDSWHMNRKIMLSTGAIDAEGRFVVVGSYPAPPAPDWGWRIALTIHSADSIDIAMHNISPEGIEDIAVRAEFARAG